MESIILEQTGNLYTLRCFETYGLLLRAFYISLSKMRLMSSESVHSDLLANCSRGMLGVGARKLCQYLARDRVFGSELVLDLLCHHDDGPLTAQSLDIITDWLDTANIEPSYYDAVQDHFHTMKRDYKKWVFQQPRRETFDQFVTHHGAPIPPLRHLLNCYVSKLCPDATYWVCSKNCKILVCHKEVSASVGLVQALVRSGSNQNWDLSNVLQASKDATDFLFMQQSYVSSCGPMVVPKKGDKSPSGTMGMFAILRDKEGDRVVAITAGHVVQQLGEENAGYWAGNTPIFEAQGQDVALVPVRDHIVTHNCLQFTRVFAMDNNAQRYSYFNCI